MASQQIDPTPFIDIRPRGHRPFLGRAPRITLSSATVDAATGAQIAAWMRKGDDALSRGVVLDRLVAFAVISGFDPRRILCGLEIKQAGAPSTEQPARTNKTPQRARRISPVKS